MAMVKCLSAWQRTTATETAHIDRTALMSWYVISQAVIFALQFES